MEPIYNRCPVNRAGSTVGSKILLESFSPALLEEIYAYNKR